MLRVISIALAFSLTASSAALAVSPTSSTPTTITSSSKSEEGVNWTVTLAFSADGRLREVQLDCDGRPYARAPAAANFPPNATGTHLSVYPETSCSKGPVELTVFAIPSPMGVPSIYIPVAYYFKDGRFISSDVRGLQHLPLSDIEKYCP